jgi:glutamate 5-kinase
MRTQLTPKDIIDNSKRLVIKIGTNSIIDVENWVVKRLWLRKSIESYVALNREFGIVSSGAIGMARVEMGGQLPKDIDERQAFAGIGQISLIKLYEFELKRAGISRVAQALYTKQDLTTEPGLSTTKRTMASWRKLRTVYVANANDTVANDEIKLGDNDNLGALTAEADDADTLTLITDVNGLYTANPKTNPDAQHIQIVETLTPEVMAMAGGTNGDHGTGGMVTKLEAAFVAASKGINTIIVNGEKPDCLTRLFNGEYGHATFIPHTAYPYPKSDTPTPHSNI